MTWKPDLKTWRPGLGEPRVITEPICEHLDDLEDLYLAEQRLIDIRAGKT
jgi:RHH-type rel operon transcriptional repressor/antitoxin RelB